MRRALIVLSAVVAAALPVPIAAAGADAPATVRVPERTVRTVPSGFSQTVLATLAAPTTIDPLPDGRMIILEQDGRVRLRTAAGTLRATPALTLTNICGGAGTEQGLLGVTHDPEFATNKFVYLYYTRVAGNLPGGCANRVSRFRMVGNRLDASTEKVLVDKLSANNGNHNGGDIGFGKDGYLYIAVGDSGADPRGDSGAAGDNNAAQDRSLLNGKILRITPAGLPAPGNPYSGAGTARCAKRGNTAATPTTICQEIWAYGLRNPFRFAFDPNASGTRLFINDVGQGTYEEVNRGKKGANYGWNTREGACPQGQMRPCPGPAAGLTDPIEAYDHSRGQFITGGAFVPVGSWPTKYDGGYLFGDGGSGDIWLRTRAGDVAWSKPVFTDFGYLVDLQFVEEDGRLVLYYTQTSGAFGRITYGP